MNTLSLYRVKAWAKQGETPLARRVWRLAKGARSWSLPLIPPLHRLLYRLYLVSSHGIATLMRTLWWTPLFQSRLTAPAPRLYLYGGIPYISGPVAIAIGADCRLSAAMTISGRTASKAPSLVIGNNVGIGWQTTLAVGSKIVLGDNVRIAGRAFLAGYPGHPLDARARARGLPDADETGRRDRARTGCLAGHRRHGDGRCHYRCRHCGCRRQHSHPQSACRGAGGWRACPGDPAVGESG